MRVTLRVEVKLIILQAACVLLAIWAPSCRGHKAGASSVVGSTSIEPFAEMLAVEFNAKGGAYVEVQDGGSSAGVQALDSGIADIGMVSRDLTPEETQRLRPITIARDGLAIIVNPSNPLTGLSHEQVADIFAGRITNWSQVGGRGGAIHVISREEGSGTRESFMGLLMKGRRVTRAAVTQESNGAVHAIVAGDPAAIGYMSLGLVDNQVKALAIDGVAPSVGAVLQGRYKFARPFNFAVRRDKPVRPGAKAFIDFVLSDKGQSALEQEGLVRAPAAKEAT